MISVRKLAIGLAVAAVLAVPGTALADQGYADPPGDAVGGALDVGTVDVSNDNAGNFTFIVRYPAGVPELPVDGVIELVIDTDRNNNTGGKEGEEVRIIFAGDSKTYNYAHWNGTKVDYDAASKTTRLSSVSGGLMITVNKSELDGVGTFDFWLYADKFTADAFTGMDSAPDGAAVWTYTEVTKPVVLKLDAPAGRRPFPVAGTKFGVSTIVMTSTGTQVVGGTVQCVVKVGTKQLAARGFFQGGIARCEFAVPKKTSGKMVRGTIAVSVRGGQASKPFSFKVL